MRIPTTPGSSTSSSSGSSYPQQPVPRANQQSGFSTPITALRDLEHPQPPSRNTKVSHIPEPIIAPLDNQFETNEYGDGTTESIAGSDVGSIMDLDDFEKSL